MFKNNQQDILDFLASIRSGELTLQAENGGPVIYYFGEFSFIRTIDLLFNYNSWAQVQRHRVYKRRIFSEIVNSLFPQARGRRMIKGSCELGYYLNLLLPGVEFEEFEERKLGERKLEREGDIKSQGSDRPNPRETEFEKTINRIMTEDFGGWTPEERKPERKLERKLERTKSMKEDIKSQPQETPRGIINDINQVPFPEITPEEIPRVDDQLTFRSMAPLLSGTYHELNWTFYPLDKSGKRLSQEPMPQSSAEGMVFLRDPRLSGFELVCNSRSLVVISSTLTEKACSQWNELIQTSEVDLITFYTPRGPILLPPGTPVMQLGQTYHFYFRGSKHNQLNLPKDFELYDRNSVVGPYTCLQGRSVCRIVRGFDFRNERPCPPSLPNFNLIVVESKIEDESIQHFVEKIKCDPTYLKIHQKHNREFITSRDLFQGYKAWAQMNGIPLTKERSFFKFISNRYREAKKRIYLNQEVLHGYFLDSIRGL